MAGIYKAYDIRGIYPAELNEEIIQKIGKAFGTIKGKNIVVGSDVRKSSSSLKQALINGLLSVGVNVTDIENVSTPMVIFATANNGFDGSIMITASHNPPQYNGLKLFDEKGTPISYEDGIDEIESLAKQENFPSNKGELKTKDIYQDYSNFLLKNLNIDKINLKIVIDCFNGADSKIVPQVFRRLGANVIEIRCDFNGDFPEIGPNPGHKGNLELLRQKVLDEKADIGFAYDGDGDRLAVIGPDGRIIDNKITFSLLVKNIPERSKVVYDILTSDMVVQSIKKMNKIPIVCRVGHTYITKKLLEEKAPLAGELSGHYYFKETFGGDDALFASLKLLECLILKEIDLQKYIASQPVYFSDEERVLIKKEEKWNFINNLKEEFLQSHKINTLDGVKVVFDKGWIVFRPSNTEPKISVTYESSDEQEFKKIEKLAKDIIERIPK